MLEVATQIGIDRKALSRLEANKTVRFDGEVLEKLCVFYGVGVGDILQLVEDTPETN
jgi:DNA-binding Xre family transcriptional regulator